MNLIETGHHEVNADGDPDLGAHGILRGSEEGLDAQVLLDPLEEQFDPPSALVNRGDGQRRQVEVVGQEDEPLASHGIEAADTSESLRVVEFSFRCAQPDGLVAAQAGFLVDRTGLQNVEPGVALGSNHKVCPGLVDVEQACEIEVATIEDIDAARFESDLVEEMDIVNRPVRDADKHGDRAGHVDLSVQLDRSLGGSKARPGKHRQAKVDGRGIDRINHLAEIQPVGVVGMESLRLANENLSERFVNAPVPMLVGVSEIGPGDVPAKAHCVKMGATSKTGFDVPKALPESDLSEGHREKLVAGRHASAASRHRVQRDAAIELLSMNEIDDLGENETSGVHPLLRMNLRKKSQLLQMRHT